MLTVDFDRFPVARGNRLLDLGCGDGRHAFAAYKRGADVVAVDMDDTALKHVRDMFLGIAEAGEAPAYAHALALRGDAFALPFPDNGFDHVIAAEVFEHLDDDRSALAEATRVLAPGGLLAITVPRWWPERVCWALSDAYHEVEGGHVRIYRRRELIGKVTDAGLEVIGTHHAHALHSAFWWLKCAGLTDDHAVIRRYHDLLVWEMMHGQSPVRLAEQVLNPLLGKSFIVYARKPR
jgi:SAM-dependent methyltransferase